MTFKPTPRKIVPYFPDNSFVQLLRESDVRVAMSPDVRRVGWISPDRDFPTGVPDPAFVTQLEFLLSCEFVRPYPKGSKLSVVFMKYRGKPQASPFGDRYPSEDVYINNIKVPIGNFMLATPRPSGNGKFLAPSHILYYVKEHNYLPPVEYVESVMSLNEDSDYTYSEENPYYVVPKSDVNDDLAAEKLATYPLYDRKNFYPHNREVKF